MLPHQARRARLIHGLPACQRPEQIGERKHKELGDLARSAAAPVETPAFG